MGASLPYNHWDYGRYTPWQVVKMWARMCGWMNGFDASIHPRSPVSSIFKVGTPFNKSPIHSCLQERPWKVRGRSFLHKFLTMYTSAVYWGFLKFHMPDVSIHRDRQWFISMSTFLHGNYATSSISLTEGSRLPCLSDTNLICVNQPTYR